VKLSARLLCLATLIAGCGACAVVPPQPEPGPMASFPGSPICTVGDADSFVAAVKVLRPDYNPEANTYSSPIDNTIDTTLPNNIRNDLRNAFNNAPDFFQRHLCDLNGIYITLAGCSGGLNNCSVGPATLLGNSWGFRETRSPEKRRYVAISAGLWRLGGSAPAYHQFENLILGYLLPSHSMIPRYNNAIPRDDSWMTVTAALAHELGHVRWYDVNVPVIGQGYDGFSTLTQACPDHQPFFRSWRYDTLASLAPPRWRRFGDVPPDTSRVDHLLGPSIAKIKFARDVRSLGKDVAQIYDSGQWPSLFGSFTPDEDFVESYKLYVLTAPSAKYPLQSLRLAISHGGDRMSLSSRDVPATLRAHRNSELEQKLACIRNLPYPPPR
jgi:hypothetical protein